VPRGRRAASATLQRPFSPTISLQPNTYLLAYFYSATVASFHSALDNSLRRDPVMPTDNAIRASEMTTNMKLTKAKADSKPGKCSFLDIRHIYNETLCGFRLTRYPPGEGD
jgi:hypothetical protein